MPVDLEVDLSLIGTELSAIGEIIAVIAAKKQDEDEAADLAVLSDLLILIGDIISLKGTLLQNQESEENGEDIGEAQRLETISAWLDVVSDFIALKGSLHES